MGLFDLFKRKDGTPTIKVEMVEQQKIDYDPWAYADKEVNDIFERKENIDVQNYI